MSARVDILFKAVVFDTILKMEWCMVAVLFLSLDDMHDKTSNFLVSF